MMRRRNQRSVTRSIALALSLSLACMGSAIARADAVVLHATRSGGQTLDQGEGGGNPFASALIELLARGDVALKDLPELLRAATRAKSRGFQEVDAPAIVAEGNWRVGQRQSEERRVALVLVVADYGRSGGAATLAGAARDARRIAEALQGAGFETEIVLDRSLAQMRRSLGDFASKSAMADAAVIYTTGHGVEVDDKIRLLPGDYPVALRNGALADRALPLTEIASASKARRVNLVFYAGCRDNPFAE